MERENNSFWEIAELIEKEVNAALSRGFEPIRDFETARGLVMVLGLWKQE